jgi:SAM-dependent methyltransferase
MTLPDLPLTNRYAPIPDLVGRVDAALRTAGLDLDRLTPEDLAPLDQFHTLGLVGTTDLADMAQISATDRVLDVGSGIGGPARYLAATRGCTVVGVDLTNAYVQLATHLTALTRQSNRVSFQCANALRLPFESEAFDVAWTQHVAMNIADRPALYGEIHRVLRPAGRLAIFDVVEGDGRPLHFPVPWANVQAESFLLTSDGMRAVLDASGFAVLQWRDVTEAVTAWLDARRADDPALPQPPLLGIHLLLGPSFRTMLQNLARNAAEGRVRFTMAVLARR